MFVQLPSFLEFPWLSTDDELPPTIGRLERQKAETSVQVAVEYIQQTSPREDHQSTPTFDRAISPDIVPEPTPSTSRLVQIPSVEGRKRRITISTD